MNNQAKKNKFLKEFLNISSKTGWNISAFEHTKKKLKFNISLIEKMFPKKLDDLILYYNYSTNQKLSKIYKKKRFNRKSIRACILNAVKIRFELLNKDKTSIKKSLGFLSHPSKQILTSKLIYNTVDHFWKLIADKSTDYNFYTKRAILASIYSAAIMIWINDKSDNLDKTFSFCSERLEAMTSLAPQSFAS